MQAVVVSEEIPLHIVEPYAKIVKFMGEPKWIEDGRDDQTRSGVDALRFIEETGRKCYRSEGASTLDSYKQFVSSHAMASRHTSMLRFSCVVVDFMVDRGVAQEITRHGKTLDFQHESQRYCNYVKDKFGNSVGFIKPRGLTDAQSQWWERSMYGAEMSYFEGLRLGLKPQLAADALPRATASLLSAVGNFQSWRHFLLTRTTKQCHPKLLNVTNDDTLSEAGVILQNSLLDQFKATFPIIFDDIEHNGDFVWNMGKPR
jgi:thymidylate synthase (FAD)